jgi:hypothetical protein
MSLDRLYTYITESFILLAGLPSSPAPVSAAKTPTPARDQQSKKRGR